MSRAPAQTVAIVPQRILAAAWLGGLAAALAGMLDLIAGLSPGLAAAELLWLLPAPVLWWFRGTSHSHPPGLSARSSLRVAWMMCGFVAAVSLAMSAAVAAQFGPLPPAYHDEFSYLLQAKTFLAGRLSYASHPDAPELFDQVHVLNEGRFASRYFPGAGAWMAPFVAIGRPYWGHWLAGAITAAFVFWTGRELSGNRVGLVAGLVTALSPGMALFSNLLLAHHPTLVGLSLFLWAFVRMQRTWAWSDALLAGGGLCFAALCRPATAAGVGLPFGIWFAVWIVRGNAVWPRLWPGRMGIAASMAAPLAAGTLAMLAYNHALTGNIWKTPYHVYLETYTPRHVYGFNNVIRGEKRIGPKNLSGYDGWAENLTPAGGLRNARDRLIMSWEWTFGIVPLGMAAIVFVGQSLRRHQRWWLVLAGIVSLHAVHVPYWYVGIMGWHYVFESGPLWALVFARGVQILIDSSRARRLAGAWCFGLTLLAWGGIYIDVDDWSSARMPPGIAATRFPRARRAALLALVEREVAPPALVLVRSDPADFQFDMVVNEPDLQTAEILYGRYDARTTDLERIARLFPDRRLYLLDVEAARLQPLPGEAVARDN